MGSEWIIFSSKQKKNFSNERPFEASVFFLKKIRESSQCQFNYKPLFFLYQHQQVRAFINAFAVVILSILLIIYLPFCPFASSFLVVQAMEQKNHIWCTCFIYCTMTHHMNALNTNCLITQQNSWSAMYCNFFLPVIILILFSVFFFLPTFRKHPPFWVNMNSSYTFFAYVGLGKFQQIALLPFEYLEYLWILGMKKCHFYTWIISKS